ncbi:MAG: PilC/PilY family type IV pilus protein [Candidatus Krumholzibacteria bacterium]|nr:PilC/PilY family type IV pilus protein [Candidatus Krumholzibacteria bacterium]MDH4338300.1 PilC/PilY family type IV pilus protein [Candidatus Krumholzibacteria bacterium]MDH5268933.1 PilC/PilY family type IV pilus protein [Candidatus Krumholzibacteria bacterium]
MRTRLIIGIMAACVLAGVAPAALAQSCDYPLFVLQGSVDANVVFLFDSSGSMNEAIMHDNYDAGRNWSGAFNRSRDYNVNTTGTYSPRSFINSAPTTPTAKLAASDQGEAGSYTGNYLNWVFYHATATERAEIPVYTRIQLAKAAVNAVIAAADSRIRFGVFKFNGEIGGLKVSDLGTDRATIATQVNAIRGSGYTPLAEALVTIKNYFTYDANAIQYACQRNFVVIATDGLPTRDDNSGYTDTNGNGYALDEVAAALKDADLWGDADDGKQYANTYTIGMNIDAPVLADAAAAGEGSYFTANNAAELSNSLARVLRDIVNRISSGAAVAVVSTEGGTADYLYRAKFLPSDWTGYLEAFQQPYLTGDLPVWEAGDVLLNRSPGSRTIFTSVGGTRRDFSAGQAGNLRAALGAASDAEAAEIIAWTRGEDVAGYRVRENGWILGDIVESSPVPVGPPGGYSLYNDYAGFYAANANRERVIYVGANDAMVHAFLASTGEELWAYIPNDQLGNLSEIADPDYCHHFSVNLTPRVADVYVNNAWRTVLVGGEKQGGAAYFALDITDPNNPDFMWENNIASVSASWAQPEIVRMANTNDYVAFVGSGLDAAGEARLVGFSMEDGSSVSDIALSSIADLNMATSCTSVDLNLDEVEDVMYVADLAGNLWRIDLTSGTPSKQLLFQTSGEPIQAEPTVTVDYDRDVYIYFGTGRYVHRDDMLDTSARRYYCIIDRNDGQTVTMGDLVDQTSTINEVEAADGWYLDLDLAPGQRVTEPSAIVAGIVYFTCYAPNSEPCSAGGNSWLYAVQFRNGAGYDGDDDSGNDTTDNRYTDLGDGIVTKPVVDIVNEKVLIQNSDTRILAEDTYGLMRQLIVRSWRQQY